MTEITPCLRAVIGECRLTDAARVTEDAQILLDLLADSLGRLEIAMTLEEEFGVSISDEDIETIQGIGEVISPDPARTAAGLALAQAEYDAERLRRQLRRERWASIVAVAAATLLAILPCSG